MCVCVCGWVRVCVRACVAMIAHGLALLGYMKDGTARVHVRGSGSVVHLEQASQMRSDGRFAP